MVATQLSPSSQRNFPRGLSSKGGTIRPLPFEAPAVDRDAASPPAVSLPPDWTLELGGTVENGHLPFSITGPHGAPVVVALGGISANRRVTDWWRSQAGPGRALDTHRYRVLSFDYVGGNGVPATAGGDAVPAVTTTDQARALAEIVDRLEIERVHALVGASYGGMVGLAFAARFPHRLGRLVAISAADRTHPLATGWRSVQREIVRFGARSGRLRDSVTLARALAMTTYRTAAELEERFDQPPEHVDGRFRFPIEAYLEARGEAFAESFDARAFLCLSESIDLHRVDPAEVRVPTTLVAVTGDQLVPAGQIRRLAERLGDLAELVEIDSLYGHDAFLKEHGAIATAISNGLNTVPASPCAATREEVAR